ncbi:protease [Ktedonosporobacter rubrisoli]|uniref:Protease n=1 Tax=Ktedonosporobacter rubrisoli TaxID=2509675 RepID=A0A4P6JUZ9_KTERU|nr:S53 family peptidase [Ktedonosporobacter rubrisoli]QBD79215.1 protease [Ktedonosporobacter rubrisoli]
MPRWPRLIALLFMLLLFSACQTNGGNGSQVATSKPAWINASTLLDTCPAELKKVKNCYTPYGLRRAYGLETLTEQGFTGKGQTVVDIVSYGSPFLQKDLDVFSKQFGLPPVKVQVIAPLGTVPFDANNAEMVGWAEETELDVEMIHALAPEAQIVVMTSPVDETEGTIGLPEFLKLEQYAVNHHLGQIFSQSFVATEVTLKDGAGQQLVKDYSDFYRRITTQEGWTILSGSGDHGATDWTDLAGSKLSPTPVVNFPADVPWVTSVGGTVLQHTATGYAEQAWKGSGGGSSQFFSQPDYQKNLPPTVQSQLAGRRGLPDLAADASPDTSMAIYFAGSWNQVGGTSASTPLVAGIVAVANQTAGHALGFLNPGIYKMAAQKQTRDFRDITEGDNSVDGPVKVQGFAAATGWDAVTGWGSPQASQFIPDLITALK